MSFSIEWQADTDEAQTYEDPAKQFLIEGFPATATGEFAVTVPELGFTFNSTMASSESAIAILGDEVNGYYYLQDQEPGSAATPVASPID